MTLESEHAYQQFCSVLDAQETQRKAKLESTLADVLSLFDSKGMFIGTVEEQIVKIKLAKAVLEES